MNKTIFVVLAICLISVQAFVKRDAPTEKPTDIEDFFQKVQEGTKALGEKISETFKPDNLKKSVDGLAQSISKTIDGWKPKEEPKA